MDGAKGSEPAEGRCSKKALSLLLTEIYVDVVAPDLDRIALDTYGRIGRQLPGSYVVFPTVPRTYDYLSLQLTFAKRAAAMQAYVIDCK